MIKNCRILITYTARLLCLNCLKFQAVCLKIQATNKFQAKQPRRVYKKREERDVKLIPGEKYYEECKENVGYYFISEMRIED